VHCQAARTRGALIEAIMTSAVSEISVRSSRTDGAPTPVAEPQPPSDAAAPSSRRIRPTDVEAHFDPADIIVSKTDLKGRITYANSVFCGISGFALPELIGAPHSLIRHPDMPRAVFKLLWDTILDRREVFAYVKNLAKSGDYYWVFAHVTPSYAKDGQMIGFHSNRRVPERRILDDVIVPLYADVLAEEAKHRNGKDALAAGFRHLVDFVSARKMTYEELVFSL
jgi:PAS domain S-box-containing protein